MNTIKTPFSLTRPAIDYPSFDGRTGTLYVVESAGLYKIGVTRNFVTRFRCLSQGSPLPVAKVATRTVPAAGVMHAEAWLHQMLADRRVKGEWFAVELHEIRPLLKKAVAKAEQYDRACAASYDDWYAENRPALLREALRYFDQNDPAEAARIREEHADILEHPAPLFTGAA